MHSRGHGEAEARRRPGEPADLNEGIVGSLYRSQIFYTSPMQRRVAEETIRDVDASGHWLGKTATKISEASVFWQLGPVDQDYFLRSPRLQAPIPRQDDTSENLAELAQPLSTS